MENLEQVKSKIVNASRSVILSHRSPDGDSIGSSLAMHHFIKKFGKNVQVIIPDPFPGFLKWLNGADGIINYEDHKEKCANYIKEADLICCLDFNSTSRLGDLESFFKMNTSAFVLNIDHHQKPEDFADFQISDTSASSTCQLVFDFINEIGEQKLDKNIAEALYTGIVTDTGSFRFSSTTKHTHEVTSKLIELGVDPSTIHQRIFDNYSIDRLKLLGFALSERFIYIKEYSTGIIYLTEQDLQQFHFQKGDTEGLVNYPLTVGAIKMAILITEKSRKVKMSFRSKGEFRVNELAAKYFSGGGHINAAGGISDVSVLETVEKIKSILKEYAEELRA